ncbi:MAG: flagellar biosynthesis protein FlgF, partial [Comamonadaceae bacterium]
GRIKLATPALDDPLRRSEDGLFRTASQDPVPTDANAKLEVGALEGSNVNPIETMVGMIAAARQFESQLRLLQNAETSDKAAAQLLSVQG